MMLTGRERRALLYAGIAVYGYTHKGWMASAAKYLSTGLLVGELVGHINDQKLFAFPETMNAFFRTDGKLSGVHSPAAAKVIAATGLVE